MVLLHEQKLSYDTGHAQALQGHEPSDIGRCATLSTGAVASQQSNYRRWALAAQRDGSGAQD